MNLYSQNWIKMQWTLIFVFIFGMLSVQAQSTNPTVGKDFWMSFMDNKSNNDPSHELRIFISGSSSTSGTISIPLLNWTTNFNVTTGNTSTITIPILLGENINSEVIDSKGIHIESLDTISVFAINFKEYSSDATKILPMQSLGTDYIINGYSGSGDKKSEFLIVATTDDTEIEITPSVLTLGGHAAGIPYLINLNEGETYQVKANSITADLSGTRVKATPQSGDCRAFAVFGGAGCANIPTNCLYCDHVFDQHFPIGSWGNEYLIPPFLGPTSYTYRILASENATSVNIDNAPAINLNAGQFIEFNNVTGAKYVLADKAISVIQYMQGVQCSTIGDPAMVFLNANDQKIRNVTFSTVASNVIVNHIVNVVVETSDIGTVVLDGLAIPGSSFSNFPTQTQYSFAQVPISQGSHTLAAPNGFSGYVYGYGAAESYAYSVGSFKPNQSFELDSALCSFDTIHLTGPYALFQPYWNTITDTTTLGFGNGLTLVPPIINDVYVLNGFSLISGCFEQFFFAVSVPQAPIIDAITAEDSVCTLNNVQLDVTVPGNPNLFDYQWSPAYAFANPTSKNPLLTAVQSGWYSVTVSSVGSTCASATDSVYVHVNEGGIFSLEAMISANVLCVPDSVNLSFEAEKSLIYETFDNGPNPLNWQVLSGGIANGSCGTLPSTGYFMNGGLSIPRIVETVPLNVLNGGNIRFYIQIPSGNVGCDEPESGEDIVLEYSTNGGANWIMMQTFYEFAYPNFVLVTLPIPSNAFSATTSFRWRQTSFSGQNQDVWIIDDIAISSIDNSGLNFNWSQAGSLSSTTIQNPTAFPASSQMYTITIQDGLCEYIDSVFVDVDPGFTLVGTNDTSVCIVDDFAIFSLPNSGANHQFNWIFDSSIVSINGPELIVHPTTSTIYYISVSSPQGCVVNDSIVVSVTIPNLINLPSSSSFCEGDTLVVNMGNSTNIVWSPMIEMDATSAQSTLFFPSDSTNYSVSYEDVNGCVLFDTLEVDVNFLPQIALPNDTSVCSESNFVISPVIANFATSYSWNTGSITQSQMVQTEGAYWLTGQNQCGTVTDSIQIQFHHFLVDLGSDTTICLNESLNLLVNAPINYSVSWSNGVLGNQINANQIGEYWVTIIDSIGCLYADTITLSHFDSPILNLGQDTTICDNAPINLVVSQSFFSVNWNNGSTSDQISVSNSDSIFVEVVDVFGCVQQDSIIITANPSPIPQIVGPDKYCENELAIYTLTEDYPTIVWMNGSTNDEAIVQNESNNFVGVSVTNSFGCTSTDGFDISMIESPNPIVDEIYRVCDSATYLLDGNLNGASNYQWNTGDVGPQLEIGPGNYILFYDFDICRFSDSVSIISNELLFDLGEDRAHCYGDVIDLFPGLYLIDSIIWNNSSLGNSYRVEESFYLFDTVTVTAKAFGCGIGSDTIHFFIVDCNCQVFVPNSFSPNNDGINDLFGVEDECVINGFAFSIFDRWGNLIFSSTDINFAWDGKLPTGQSTQDGVYVWKMKYQVGVIEEITSIQEFSGHLTVIR